MRYHASVNHYTYRAEWWPERGEYVVRCIELPWLTRWAFSLQEATAAAEEAVDEYLTERLADGDEVPAPLTERQHNGKFMVRTSPELHTRLVIEAAEQRVSLNHWVVQKLSGRTDHRLGDLFDLD
jgi:predicted HicB family RNase H-like nuclease